MLIFRITVSPTACAKKARPLAISIHTPIANPFSPSIRFVACATPPEINTVNTVAPNNAKSAPMRRFSHKILWMNLSRVLR